MFRLLVASFLFTACAFSGERRVHFLSAMDTPDEEVMGPNMNFDELSTTMKSLGRLQIRIVPAADLGK